jgi:hypothetical protein
MLKSATKTGNLGDSIDAFWVEEREVKSKEAMNQDRKRFGESTHEDDCQCPSRSNKVKPVFDPIDGVVP